MKSVNILDRKYAVVGELLNRHTVRKIHGLCRCGDSVGSLSFFRLLHISPRDHKSTPMPVADIGLHLLHSLLTEFNTLVFFFSLYFCFRTGRNLQSSTVLFNSNDCVYSFSYSFYLKLVTF